MSTSQFLRIAGGRGYVLGAVESTEGTDPGTSASDYIHLESFESSYNREFQANTARSPYGDTFSDVPTMALMEFSGSSRIRSNTIAGLANDADASDDPDVDFILGLCGWTRERDSANNAIAYISSLTSSSSYWLDAYRPTRSAAAGLHHQIAGARAVWTLNFPSGAQPITIDFSGMGIVKSVVPGNANHPIQNYASAPHAISKPTANPFIGTGGTIRIYDGTNVYGGGSLASPSTQLRLLSASVESGFSLVPQAGHGALAGAQRIDREVGPQIINLAIEAINPGASSEFHPQALMDNQTGVFVDLRYNKPGTATDHFQYFSQGTIIGVDGPDDDGPTSIYNVRIKALSPQDLSDNDPAVGISPGQTFKANAAGTLGPAMEHASGYTQVGRSFIQFWTA